MSDIPRFSRRAIDSTNVPMDDIVTMRMPHDLHILGARKARVRGLSLGEYMRCLLAQDLNEDIVRDDDEALVMRKAGE